ncbi:hypothetical protein F4604DRAFT_1688521 [Suillus subluteus]|nr:hypothetical protein F4604DRAFT_1688521 [Suillus subluteus]
MNWTGQSGRRENVSEVFHNFSILLFATKSLDIEFEESDMGNTNRVVVEFASDVPALGSTPKISADNKATHETSGHDGIQSVEEATLSTPGVMMLDEYDYGPFDVINFGIPNELLPSTSTPALVAAGELRTSRKWTLWGQNLLFLW